MKGWDMSYVSQIIREVNQGAHVDIFLCWFRFRLTKTRRVVGIQRLFFLLLCSNFKLQTISHREELHSALLRGETAKNLNVYMALFSSLQTEMKHENSTFKCQDRLSQQNIGVGQTSESDIIIASLLVI